MSGNRFAARIRGAASGTALVVIGAVAAAPYLWGLPHFGSVQYRDYYWILSQIVDDGSFTANPITWLLIKSNEHTVTIPAVVYMLNVWLTAGDNRGLSAVAVLLMAATFVIMYRLIRSEWRRDSKRAVAIAATLAPFAFTPTAAHNVVMGFSGTIWIMANVCSLGAVAALVNRSHGGPLYPVLVFGVLGALSYSTSLFVWPALLVGSVLLRLSRRDVAALTITAGTLFVLSALLYGRPADHPAPETRNVALLLSYVLGYMGSPFTSDVGSAGVFGLFGIVIAAIVGVTTLRHSDESRRVLAPWIMIQLYVLVNAVATAVFRSGLDASPAESRYATLPALFWASLLMMSFHAIWTARDPGPESRRLQWPIAAMLVLSLTIPMYSHGVAVLRYLLDRAAYNGVAAQALVLGVHDDEMLNYVSYYPEEIWSIVGSLRSLGHVPYDRPSDSSLSAATRVDSASDTPGVVGYFDRLERVDEHYARAVGWAYSDANPVVEIAIADNTGVVRGRAVLGLPRVDVVGQFGWNARRAGWAGYVRIEGSETSYSAHARRRHDEEFFALTGLRTVEINEQAHGGRQN